MFPDARAARSTLWLALLMLFALAAAGCPSCPEVSILEGEEGLVLVQSEHPDGWGQADCLACHQLKTIHRRGCTEGVDLAAVRERVSEGGIEVCSDCHGDNGVGSVVTAVEEQGQ